MKYEISYICLSDQGRLRHVNQDNYVCFNTMKNSIDQSATAKGTVINGTRTVFAVFDGMGGEEKGEVAAELAAKALLGFDSKNKPVEALSVYCDKANRMIADYAEEHSIITGTTAAIILFDLDEIYICNIGDTRIYRCSKGKLKQISKDHVMPGPYDMKSALSQNLGIDESIMTIEPYFAKGRYSSLDRFLICSDGLTDMVSEADIESVLKSKPLEEAAKTLMNMALEHGGIDNITILICEIKGKESLLQKILSA